LFALVVAACSTAKKPQHSAASPPSAGRGTPLSLLWVQSASAGSLTPKDQSGRAYRLTLTGVDSHAVYFANRPNRQTSLRPVADMLTSLGYGKGDPPPNAAVVVAGANPDEDVRAVQLRNPSYNADRATMEYDAEPLDTVTAGLAQFNGRADRRLPERFGRVSLFIDDAHHTCRGALYNNSALDATYVSSEKWDTDSWDQAPAGSILSGTYSWWQTTGGLFRGCHNSATYALSDGTQVTVSLTDPYSDQNQYNCGVNPKTHNCVLWEDSTTSGDVIFIDYWVQRASK
jgi:hypothetical protein